MNTNKDSITLKDFLEITPPYVRKNIIGFWSLEQSDHYYIDLPELKLECNNKKCGGARFFDSEDTKPPLEGYGNLKILDYICRNCKSVHKYFCLQFSYKIDDKTRKMGLAQVIKVGEYPQYQMANIQAMRILDLSDQELFRKGLTAESLGLGVGAFSYYRRVIENYKDRLIDEITKIARNEGLPEDTFAIYLSAKSEQQFKKAIGLIKDSIPRSLFVGDHNLLTTLHTALSQGIHNKSDEDCLMIAGQVRVVFVRLTEKLQECLRDEQEVRNAIGKLQNIK